MSDFKFYIQAVLLGVGLAMDACAVSMSNGMSNKKMKTLQMALISLSFAVFQAVMPLIGYFAGHFFIEYIEKFIPYIALILLTFLGVKMIIDGVKNKEDEEVTQIGFKTVLVQSVATSIDALSVGITFANYTLLMAVITAVIIATVTFIICIIAHKIGKVFGNVLGNKAVIFGGIILILIGLEIFITGII